MGAEVRFSVYHYFVSPPLHGETTKRLTHYRLKRNKTKTKMPLVGLERSSLFLSESEVVASTPPIPGRNVVLLTYELHNKKL